jgi:hypothetical protein
MDPCLQQGCDERADPLAHDHETPPKGVPSTDPAVAVLVEHAAPPHVVKRPSLSTADLTGSRGAASRYRQSGSRPSCERLRPPEQLADHYRLCAIPTMTMTIPPTTVGQALAGMAGSAPTRAEHLPRDGRFDTCRGSASQRRWARESSRQRATTEPKLKSSLHLVVAAAYERLRPSVPLADPVPRLERPRACRSQALRRCLGTTALHPLPSSRPIPRSVSCSSFACVAGIFISLSRRPSRIVTTRSQVLATTGSCVATITVMSFSVLRSAMCWTMSPPVTESRLLTGTQTLRHLRP